MSSIVLPSVVVNQIRRHATLQKFCAKNNGQYTNYSKTTDVKNLLFSEKGNLSICLVPKIASSNWRRVFLAMSGVFDESVIEKLTLEKLGSIDKSSKLRRVHAQQMPLSNEMNGTLRQGLIANSKKVFFSRNPYERLFSAYKDKFTHPKDPHFKGMERRIFKMFPSHLSDLEREATFQEFLDFVIHENKIGDLTPLNKHWRPVTKICLPCYKRYNIIGKMETLAEDSRYVLDLANTENKNLFPVKAGNSAYTRSLLENVYSNISRNTLNGLYEMYKDDLEAFAYIAPEIVRRNMNLL